jgi:hypothetical protein
MVARRPLALAQIHFCSVQKASGRADLKLASTPRLSEPRNGWCACARAKSVHDFGGFIDNVSTDIVFFSCVVNQTSMMWCAADYSFSLTTFSPTGKLVQIEYALQAVAAGKTSLGIKGSKT